MYCLKALWVGHVEPEDKLSRDLDSIQLGLEPSADDPDFSTPATLTVARSLACHVHLGRWSLARPELSFVTVHLACIADSYLQRSYPFYLCR
jgi:hypothetical protein